MGILVYNLQSQIIDLIKNVSTPVKVVIAVVVLVWMKIMHTYLSLQWKLRKFKGPLALPFVGNIYNPEAVMVMTYWMKLRRRYGTIFTFFSLNRAYLIVTEPGIIRRVLTDITTYPKGSDYTSQFASVFGEGLVTSNGEKHKKDTNIFKKYFHKMNVGKYCSKVNQTVLSLSKEKLTGNVGKPVNIEGFFAVLALRVFMKFACNHKMPDSDEISIAHYVSKGSFTVGRFVGLNLPIKPWIPSANTALIVPPKIMEIMQPVVEARRKAMASGEISDDQLDDCLTAMVREQMSDKDIKDHIVTLICAGHDTTAFFSAYMCILLAQNPEFQDKLRAEVLATFAGREEIEVEDIYGMPNLQNFMKETLRIYAIIPNVTRISKKEQTFKRGDGTSVTIPEGTEILIPMFLVNRDPDLWDNPKEFNPDRFENCKYFTSADSGYFPFGYGARSCIGGELAQIESGIFICQLLKRFRIEPEPGFKPEIMAGISLTTTNGINVILKDL